ncbi:hypothetical protein C5Y96_02190 [Blastopirellula marina]|uniref:Uncharacterized protein n=1 Tax=Blastopirellula marina TaxID=124 RepID=A0A2S8G2N0_9BACT|nr:MULTISPECIES: hypothetical protein [Pirellulaceae]PQO38712.1 hypothetical protein C5Y96_02190 [Blastopirellula marina]RCS55020.1 hypothetical protein DTL36_02195 [Bremerella cremea]
MSNTTKPDNQSNTLLDSVLSEEGDRSFRAVDNPSPQQPYKTSSDTKGLMILMVIGGVLTMGILLLTLPEWALPFVLGGFAGLFIAVKLVLEVRQLLRKR